MLASPSLLAVRAAALGRQTTLSSTRASSPLPRRSPPRTLATMPAVRSGSHGPRPNDAKTGKKGEPMVPIPSASLVVLCPVSGSSRGGGTRYATLMVQRSARDGSSFRSAVVFPGGALDMADEDAVRQMASQGDLSPCTNQTMEAGADAAYMHSLRLCALRETFEETGLLLLPAQGAPTAKSRAIGPGEAGIEPQEWARIRNEIHNDARAFPPFLARVVRAVSPPVYGSGGEGRDGEAVLPPLAPLSHHANWVTPKAVVRPAKRFDAHFFLTVLEKADALGPLTSASDSALTSSEDLLNLSADGTETTSLRLATAGEMVELAVRDQIVLFPPQFYILADLAACLRTSQTAEPVLPPLIFRHPTAPPSTSSSPGVTTVEEEPRGLHPASTYQFERRAVTSVEPHARPASGSNVSKASLQWRGSGEGASSEMKPNSSGNDRDDDDDEPFVFPLVLPGDFLASKEQQANMSGAQPSSGGPSVKPLNRVYVTPRSREDGGGLTVRGARRRGLPGLIDFEEGAQLEEMGSVDEDESSASRAKL